MGPNARALLARVGAPTTFDAPARAAAVRDDARDRRRLRARARRADELRRRPRLRAVRADRDGAPRLPRAARGERRPGLDGGGLPTPATTRSTRCASRLVGAPGAPSWRPTTRRSRPGSAYAVKLDKPTTSSARRRCVRLQRRAAAQEARHRRRSTTGDAYAWGGEALLHRRRAGRRAGLGRLERRRRPLPRPGYVRGSDLAMLGASRALTMDLWGAWVTVTACDRWAPPAPASSNGASS